LKTFFKSLSVKKIVFTGSVVLALILALILKLISNSKINKLDDQLAADRWGNVSDVTQISVFFSETYHLQYYDVRSFEETLKKKLTESSIVSESENENARMWVDAYSCKGTIDLKGNAGKASPVAYAVGGDFFTFHPLKLVNGSYFSKADVMQDYILLDRDLAWQLFGSDDIIGQQVWYGDLPLLVLGVYERAEGKLNDAAGNDKPTAYISYDTYSTIKGADAGVDISCYEMVIPNPVVGFGIKLIQDNFKLDDGAGIIIENSTRFSFLNLLKVVGKFGTRSMSSYSIIYPYWENLARGCEDILSLLLLIRCILYLYSLVIFIIFLVGVFKGIPYKKIKIYIADRYDEIRSGQRKLPLNKKVKGLKVENEEES